MQIVNKAIEQHPHHLNEIWRGVVEAAKTSAQQSGATMGGGIAAIIRHLIQSHRHMATGGVVTEPTLALIGEGDRPEAVMPLPYGERTLDYMLGRLDRLERESVELRRENKRLREQVFTALYELVKINKKTYKLLESWEVLGQPPERTATA